MSNVLIYRSAQWSMSTPRTLLIVTMSMCYGMELTYKLATKQLIFIINPCHVMCLLQLTVLCLNPFTSVAQHLFRIMLNGMFFPLCTGSLHVFTNPEFSICNGFFWEKKKCLFDQNNSYYISILQCILILKSKSN